MALSKCRSKFEKKHKRIARKFLREARTTSNTYDRRERVNREWVKGAGLQSVMDYLSSQIS